MAIGQEKAFYRIDHEYVISSLEAINLPDIFIRWVKILYNITSKIEVNGAYTEEINILRSVRQGCPLTMLLFIGAEELSTELNGLGYSVCLTSTSTTQGHTGTFMFLTYQFGLAWR